MRRLGFICARLLGYRPWVMACNPEQSVWARTRQQADTVRVGQTVYVLLPKWIQWMVLPYFVSLEIESSHYGSHEANYDDEAGNCSG